jgi:hypothetical protein
MRGTSTLGPVMERVMESAHVLRDDYPLRPLAASCQPPEGPLGCVSHLSLELCPSDGAPVPGTTSSPHLDPTGPSPGLGSTHTRQCFLLPSPCSRAVVLGALHLHLASFSPLFLSSLRPSSKLSPSPVLSSGGKGQRGGGGQAQADTP